MRVIIPKARETGRWSGELMAVHKDGRTFPVWLSTSVVKSEYGRPITMITSLQDITGRKQAEETTKQDHDQLMMLVEERTRELSSVNEKLLKEITDRGKMEQELLKAQKLESLGILAGGIAHDFNNLLASIAGNISLAMLDIDPKNSSYRQLEGAKNASLRAQDLTLQMLTFSKGGEPVRKSVAIADLIREVTGFAVRGSRVKFFFSLPEDLWPANVDESQISQVIHNLIINADHAMPKGGTITISCENVVVAAPSKLPLRQGSYVRINVRDHGVGILREHLAKIFDPYFTTKKKGSGLGLAMAYAIISQHGGHILAESEPGKGTTFIIYLPAAVSGTA
jgi:signal transduction histidine kinase